MSRGSVDEKVLLEAILMHEYCNLVKMPSFSCKVSLWYIVIPKNDNFYDWGTKSLVPF